LLFISAFNSNLHAGTLCGFFSVKRKRSKLGDSHSTGGKPIEDVPFRFIDKSQRICVTVAAIMKLVGSETVVDAPPQQRAPFPAELGEDLQKVGNDP
jgi:hypothetical protein